MTPFLRLLFRLIQIIIVLHYYNISKSDSLIRFIYCRYITVKNSALRNFLNHAARSDLQWLDSLVGHVVLRSLERSHV